MIKVTEINDETRFEIFIRNNLAQIQEFLDYLTDEEISAPTDEQFIDDCVRMYGNLKEAYKDKKYADDTNELCYLGSQALERAINRLLPEEDQWYSSQSNVERISAANLVVNGLISELKLKYGPKAVIEGKDAEIIQFSGEVKK